MAESNFIDEKLNNEKFQSVQGVRRKLERFRSKLTELFFSTNTTTLNNIQVTNTVNIASVFNNDINNSSIVQHPDDNNSMLISNCYYGYTSPISEEDLRLSCMKKSKIFNKNHTSSSSSSSSTSSSSSSACSSSSSMIIDDDEHSSYIQNGELILSQYPVNYHDSHSCLPQSLTTGVITLNKSHITLNPHPPLDYYSFNSQLNSNHSNFDTSSLNTNEEENPFLNKRLTDQIYFNSELSVLSTYFESALDLIDDQDNFFNIDFMTNYISYVLLKNITDSILLDEIKCELKLNPSLNNEGNKNLLKIIAEDIYNQSCNEPCGLKGAKISIFVQTREASNNNESQFQTNDTLVAHFPFGTSRFGTFDLNLTVFKNDQNEDLESSNNIEQSQYSQSALVTLTRRIFSNNTNQKSTRQYHSDNIKTIYLDSNTYSLFKTNVAYE
jgi:hypothetical protein